MWEQQTQHIISGALTLAGVGTTDTTHNIIISGALTLADVGTTDTTHNIRCIDFS